MTHRQKLNKLQFYRKRCEFIDKSVSLAKTPYSIGCIDARKGILNTILNIEKACSHVPKKITEFEFTDDVTKG